MSNKLKIAFVDPGIMEIPPKTWGAIEKVIWNYKINLEKMGHTVDLKNHWKIKKGDYDIVHCHIANQALEINDDYEYIFSLHDHHTYLFGKNSDLFKTNLKAMKKSIISITHAEYLVDYFDTVDKLFYLEHGVDSNLYSDKGIHKYQQKLLCVAHNGLINNPTYDRKGFRLSIEAAKQLNLPITIVGTDNGKFFEANKDLLDYDKLEIIESPSEPELIDIYNDHTIFLHLSDLEAGHPNLTILESLSCGLPVVGTYKGTSDLSGLVKTELVTQDVTSKIKYVMNNYEYLKSEALKTAKKYDWYNVTKKLEDIYLNVLKIKDNFTSEKMRNGIINIYENTIISNHGLLKELKEYEVDFNDGAKITIIRDSNYHVRFIDLDKKEIVYELDISGGKWAKTNVNWYTNWLIDIQNKDENTFDAVQIDLNNKYVHIIMDDPSVDVHKKWIKHIDEFRKKHNCVIYCSSVYYMELEKDFNDIIFVKESNDISPYATYYIKMKDGMDPESVSRQILGLI